MQNTDLPKLLRALASSLDAKRNKHDVIFNAAADELEKHRRAPNDILLHLTEESVRHLCENSIERVVNTSMTLDEIVMASADGLRSIDEAEKDRADVNYEDWTRLKTVVVRLWWNAQKAARERKMYTKGG